LLFRIDKDILRFLLPTAALAVICLVAGWVIAGIVFCAVALFLLYFFRDPQRDMVSMEEAVISPVDGRVVGIETVSEPEYLGGKAMKISIFLNLFDVHMNYSPVSGKVEYVQYHRGRYVNAARPLASKVNARNAIGIQNRSGKIFVNQITGVIARRVVCRLEPGQQIQQGQKFGLMRFGSRAEVYVPGDCEVLVKTGQKVIGGITPIIIYGKQGASNG
jgi:phosphatidylserine decarboxylase